jgi:Protein of unknown function (DUF3618)
MATDEPEVVDPADEPAEPDDGGDVAGRDPDEIAREIEQTRAELTDTIDAIAERISPKRAASRGAQAVKAQVSGVMGKTPEVGEAVSSVVGAQDGAAADDSVPDFGGSSPASPASRPVVPIAVTAGVVLVVLLWLRRRRSR